MKFLDKVGLTYWTSKIKSYVNNKIEDLKTLLSKDIEKKQDELTAGDNITIDLNNKISATDTIYNHPSTHQASMITETTDRKWMSSSERTKLAGIEDNANHYTHPSSHSATMINETTNRKFVSENEKSSWDEKLDKNSDIATNPVSTTPGESNPSTLIEWLMTLSNKFNEYLQKSDMGNTVAPLDTTNKKVPVDFLPAEALKDTTYTAGSNITITNNKISATDTVYTHPNTHSASIITETTDKKFMTSVEKTKLDGIEANANNYTHPSSHSASMITETTSKRFVSDTEKTTWNNKQDKITAGSNITIDSSNKISATVPVQSVNSKTGAVTITKSDVGLGSVENIGIIILSEAEYEALSDTEKARTDKLYGVS